MLLYKLTDENDCTKGNTQWGPNITHTAAKGKCFPCTRTAIHAYDHPLKAVFLNPIHGNYQPYHLWEAEGKPTKSASDNLKLCCKSLTTLRRIEPPIMTTNQRVRAAIYITLEVYKAPAFVNWANAWCSGKDRTRVVWAWVAEAAAAAATEAATEAAWGAAAAAAATEAATAAAEAWAAAAAAAAVAAAAEAWAAAATEAAWGAAAAEAAAEAATAAATEAAVAATEAAAAAWAAAVAATEAEAVARVGKLNLVSILERAIADEEAYDARQKA